MSQELSLAIQQVCEEKGLSLEAVKETIEEALAAAFRKDFGDKKTQNIKVDFELESGKFDVFDIKEVVEDELQEKYEALKAKIEELKEKGEEITPELMEELQGKHTHQAYKSSGDHDKKSEENEAEEEEEEKKFNPRTMISLSEAKQEKKSVKLGDELIIKLDVPSDFGRMAAQTAKQVIIQKLREAERNNIFEEYKDKVGELIVGTVQRQEGRVVLIDLGSVTGIVLPVDMSKSDNYKPGARMKFYIKSVEQSNKGPEILLSRTHPEMLRKLFKLEVPEINAGSVQIKSIARDAGGRAKIAVFSKEEDLDPIGACIGQRGTRVQTIINELAGEKIDIIEWNEDLNKFIVNALAPAKILKVEIDEENKTAKSYVAEDQYSLAIGKGGQNVRLAAQLVGMRIDVVMEGKEEGEDSGDSEDANENDGAESGDEAKTKEDKKKEGKKKEVKEELDEDEKSEEKEEEEVKDDKKDKKKKKEK